MRHRRDHTPSLFRAISSDRICRNILEWEVFHAAQTVMLYAPMRSEADIWPVAKRAMKAGKTVLLPVVRGQDILAVSIDKGTLYRVSDFGVREPMGEEFCPIHIELILAPGLAFDRFGNRLGYGGGYYDRFFPRTPALRCGIAFGAQVVRNVPCEGNDAKLHYVAVEEGIFQV